MKLYKILVGMVLVFITVMFMQCEKVTEISELIKNTEKIQVVFYNDSLPDTFVDIEDKKEIKKFKSFITDDDVPVLKCGYDGRIIFFMDNDLTEGPKNSVSMEFNFDDDCMHVAYQYAASLNTKRLSMSGAEYLKKLDK